MKFPWKRLSFRVQVLLFFISLISLSLWSSLSSLDRVTEVSQNLELIQRVSAPMGQIFIQLQKDSEIFQREIEKNTAPLRWTDPHWKPKGLPKWIGDILTLELKRLEEFIRSSSSWMKAENQKKWETWVDQSIVFILSIQESADQLTQFLEPPIKGAEHPVTKNQLLVEIQTKLEAWMRHLKWGMAEYEKLVGNSYQLAGARIHQLRVNLRSILGILVVVSFSFLWFGLRAFRPLAELTDLARNIAQRGLKKGDQLVLSRIPMARKDEVSQLVQEFRRMTTALLEREKTVEFQKRRLEEQNRLLRTMGELNESVINSIQSILIVIDFQGVITQCNTSAAAWLGKNLGEILNTAVKDWGKLRPLLNSKPGSGKDNNRFQPICIDGRTMGGKILPIDQDGQTPGSLVILDDLTEEFQLHERLGEAEKLAAVGRVSAQVAHEIRNPLHALGLEAELALQFIEEKQPGELRQCIQSIMLCVERLERITDHYLKWSKLSSGKKLAVDLREIFESVLATYALPCQAKEIHVNWEMESEGKFHVWGDRELLEQAMGNLFCNAIQALETPPLSGKSQPKKIFCKLWVEGTKIKFQINDNGPGVLTEMKEKLFFPFVSSRIEGTGLGLSFVKKVIEDHKGEVYLKDSEDRESGAAFEFAIPTPQKGVR